MFDLLAQKKSFPCQKVMSKKSTFEPNAKTRCLEKSLAQKPMSGKMSLPFFVPKTHVWEIFFFFWGGGAGSGQRGARDFRSIRLGHIFLGLLVGCETIFCTVASDS